MSDRQAFTLIELLVVMSIIGLLAAMLVMGINLVLFQAKALKTSQRMDAVQQALLLASKDQGAVYFQNAVAGFGGTAAFTAVATPGNPSHAQPAGGTPWHRCWPHPAASDPLVLAFPWGKARAYPLWVVRKDMKSFSYETTLRQFSSETWYTGSPSFGFTLPPASGASDSDLAVFSKQWEVPEAHTLAELRPTRSAALFAVLGMCQIADYLTDRSTQKPWNDAWGMPLVISYAVYQPPEFTLGSDKVYAADHYLTEGLKVYQCNRTAYFSVGAIGKTADPALLPSAITQGSPLTAAQIAGVWDQACGVCMPTPAETWTQDSFGAPPWKGVKAGTGNASGAKLRSFLAAPIEIR